MAEFLMNFYLDYFEFEHDEEKPGRRQIIEKQANMTLFSFLEARYVFICLSKNGTCLVLCFDFLG